MDLLEELAALQSRSPSVARIKPGTRLRVPGRHGWPEAVLTVVKVRPFTFRHPDGSSFEEVALTTTSGHPGPAWSSYDRVWFGRYVAENLEVIA